MANSESVGKSLSRLRIAVVLAATVVCAGLTAPSVLAAKTKTVKRTLSIQGATVVSGPAVQVSGYLVPKPPKRPPGADKAFSKRIANHCRRGNPMLYRTDAAGNILQGPLAEQDPNKKGFWQLMFGPTSVNADTRFLVRQRKGPLVTTRYGKYMCGRAASAPLAPGLSSGTAPPPGGANQAPYFPPQTTTTTPHNQYSVVLGQPCLTSQTLDITISPGATDPDSDPLTYSWTASNGTINGSGLSATWQRMVQNCSTVPGIVTITASDGKGGTAQIQRSFN